MCKKVKMIYARSLNGVIGNGGKIPWKSPQDMAYFKEKTMGHAVVMGRKTWESLPDRFKPLPGRENIVVTRQLDYSAFGAMVVNNLDDAVMQTLADVVWIIGGSDIYNQAIDNVVEIHETVINQIHEGDALAPVIDMSIWTQTDSNQIFFEGKKLATFNVYKRLT
jgi:dihydrofolate reductase